MEYGQEALGIDRASQESFQRISQRSMDSLFQMLADLRQATSSGQSVSPKELRALWSRALTDLRQVLSQEPSVSREEKPYQIRRMPEGMTPPQEGLMLDMGGKQLAVVPEEDRLVVYQPHGMQRGRLAEALAVLQQVLDKGTMEPQLVDQGYKVTLYHQGQAMPLPTEPLQETLETAEGQVPVTTGEIEQRQESVALAAQVLESPSPQQSSLFWQRLKKAVQPERVQRAYQQFRQFMDTCRQKAQEVQLVVLSYQAAVAIRQLGNYFPSELNGIHYVIQSPGIGSFTVSRWREGGQQEPVLTVRQRNLFSPPEVQVNEGIPRAELVQLLQVLRQQASFAAQCLAGYESLEAFAQQAPPQRLAQVLGGFTPVSVMQAVMRERQREARATRSVEMDWQA